MSPSGAMMPAFFLSNHTTQEAHTKNDLTACPINSRPPTPPPSQITWSRNQISTFLSILTVALRHVRSRVSHWCPASVARTHCQSCGPPPRLASAGGTRRPCRSPRCVGLGSRGSWSVPAAPTPTHARPEGKGHTGKQGPSGILQKGGTQGTRHGARLAGCRVHNLAVKVVIGSHGDDR